MTLPHLLAAAPFAPVDQEYLFEARQMQALSFAVHIPIVCFGIAFPAFVLMLEGVWLRTGDPIHRTIAKRWSKVMLALFAVGVVTGTILSFELGLLWPNFMATYGEVFGLGFTLEAFSFFLEAIFIAIYVYGWDRLSSATRPPSTLKPPGLFIQAASGSKEGASRTCGRSKRSSATSTSGTSSSTCTSPATSSPASLPPPSTPGAGSRAVAGATSGPHSSSR